MTYEQALRTIGRTWKRGRDIDRDAAFYWLGYHLRMRRGDKKSLVTEKALEGALVNLDRLSWCETIAATGMYHLRRLSDAGQKLTGGADAPTLCGMKPAWDVGYPVTEATVRPKERPNYGWPCPRCVDALESTP